MVNRSERLQEEFQISKIDFGKRQRKTPVASEAIDSRARFPINLDVQFGASLGERRHETKINSVATSINAAGTPAISCQKTARQKDVKKKKKKTNARDRPRLVNHRLIPGAFSFPFSSACRIASRRVRLPFAFPPSPLTLYNGARNASGGRGRLAIF